MKLKCYIPFFLFFLLPACEAGNYSSSYNQYQKQFLLYEMFESIPEEGRNTIFNAYLPPVTLYDVITLRSFTRSVDGYYRIIGFIDSPVNGNKRLNEVVINDDDDNHANISLINAGELSPMQKGDPVDLVCKNAMFTGSGDNAIIAFIDCTQTFGFEGKMFERMLAKAPDYKNSIVGQVMLEHYYRNEGYYISHCSNGGSAADCMRAVKAKSAERLNQYYVRYRAAQIFKSK